MTGGAVEVYGLLDGEWRCGSGFALGGRLVVTAKHVLANADGRTASILQVRTPGGELCEARMVWPANPGGVDVALVEVTDARWAPPVRRHPVRWGTLVGAAPRVACEATGFPDMQASPDDGLRDLEQASGAINPVTGGRTGVYAIAVDDPPQRVRDSESPWAGMSGAAVFCSGLLTAVVVEDAGGFASRRLTAVPISRVAADPAFAALVERHTGRPVVCEPVETRGLFAEPLRADSPASLLRADAATVRFRGRAELLDELIGWCEQDGWFGVRLVVGPGGQGKTRLGDHLAEIMTREGWVAGRVAENAPAEAISALRTLTRPVLLVVDYAETRAEQLKALADALSQAEVQHRLLLLARAAGDWRARLAAEVPPLTPILTASPHHLQALETTPSGREDAWRDAVTDLAAALPALDSYPDTDWDAAGTAVTAAPPSPGRSGDGTVLALHMAALAALLEHVLPVSQDTGAGVAAGGSEDVLLLHEERYWQRTAEAEELILSPTTRRRTVAAATVCSADTETEALRIAASVPGLSDLSEDRRIVAARWIAALYPAPGRFWGPLQPDRLGEHLVASVLTSAPGLLTGTATALTPGQAHHALTVLTRAAPRAPELDRIIVGLITEHPPVLVPAAVAVATETDHPEPLAAALAALIAPDATPSLSLLHQIDDALPERTQALLDLAAKNSAALVDRYRELSRTDPSARRHLAASLSNLSNRLGDLGQLEEGLAAGEEAVDVLRLLVRERPDAFLPDLAQALTNLSARLGNLDRSEQGLAAVRDAVDVYRVLARQRPQDYLPDLALSLNNLAGHLSDQRQPREALAAAKQAEKIYRVLVRDCSNAFLPGLAMSLNTLGNCLGEMDRPEEALEASEEAVKVQRGLVREKRDAFLPDLATILYNHANNLRNRGQAHEGLDVAEECVEICQELVSNRPDVFQPALTRALQNLERHRRPGHQGEADSAPRE